MSSTRYLVSFWITKQDEAAFATAVRKYNHRETLSRSYQVEVVSQREVPASDRAYSQAYLEIELACTDVLALFKFGEFWGNKTQQRWAKDIEQASPKGEGGG